MAFDVSAYSHKVQAILAVDGAGSRAMPLAHGALNEAGRKAIGTAKAAELFPDAPHPDAALAGLYLYFCDYDRSHTLSQDIPTVEGSFWHGILHRQEPDAGNAGYWFRRVGKHSIFPALRDAAAQAGYVVGSSWDPFAFIDYCEEARIQPGSRNEEIAMAIQLAEWQLLFDHCARPKS